MVEGIRVATELVPNVCITCGITYGVPVEYDRRRRDDHKDHCCPNGHWQHYSGESDADKVRRLARQLEAERENTQYYQRQRDDCLKEITSKKRVITRLKNRVHNGVCTECHRHFENLERHMKTKHHESK